MKKIRFLAPVFGLFALVALFIHLPEISKALGVFECKTCLSSSPYFTLISVVYFTLLIALSQLFPGFPNRYIARAGLIFSVLLAFLLIYINLPNVCAACVFSHICHIFSWSIWTLIPSENKPHIRLSKERLFLLVIAPITVVAFFSAANLTFKAYQPNIPVSDTSLSVGDVLPAFTIKTESGDQITSMEVASSRRSIINFISPECGHCKEQLQLLGGISSGLSKEFYKRINICSSISSDFIKEFHFMEWVEDNDGKLRKLFNVSRYPTLFVVGPSGKITQVISGVPEEQKEDLLILLNASNAG